MTSPLLSVHRDGDLLRVQLNDPARANALSPALVAELTELYGRDLRAEGVRAVLLSGAGKHFSAGADLDHLRSLADADLERNREESEKLRALFASILHQEALTLALVHGSCVAGGCGLAAERPGLALGLAAGLAGRTALDLVLSRALARRASDPPRVVEWADLAAVPVKDCCAFALWCAGWFRSTVSWRGHRLRIGKGSRLTPEEVASPPLLGVEAEG